ncbi:MAG: DUF6428 family protein [Trueperaceae bacterium]|nr:DUF6428 family protein [Trueperaceae bacterium]
MTTQDFLSALRNQPDASLHFVTDDWTVPPGYHVTEFKSVRVHSVDCGGRTNAWNETVLQVVPPAEPEAHAMTAEKFMGIYRQVAGAVPLEPDAPVRVETGRPGNAAISYLVQGVTRDAAGGLRVRLEAPGVACKAIDRSVGDLPVAQPASAGGCCGPAAPEGRDPEQDAAVAAQNCC